MCGICGKINYNGRPIEEQLLRRMCRIISYRGPDDEGVYISEGKPANSDQKIHVGLGHQRLSIIDLSSAGHQPMANEDGSLFITYNGEIYNFKELKTDLIGKGHVFQSDTDTEVILHLYEEEGTAAVHRLNGMFAFALWDANRSRLWVCRDRLGIKPLVYFWNGFNFVFASEIKALLLDPVISRNINDEALILYLSFNYIPSPYTIFKGINKLEPGHSLTLENGELEITKYWDIPQDPDPIPSKADYDRRFEYYKTALSQVLSDAVNMRLISDVPLGAFLSGGIDSSIIVALMAVHSKDPVKTFSIGFNDDPLYDETKYARQVAKHYSTDHHEFNLSYKELLAVFPEVLSTFDEPFADSSAVPTFIVSRETRKHVTVALSGDGGDELFAGYRSYLGEYWYPYYLAVPAVLRHGLFEKLVNTLPDSRNVKALEYVRRVKKFVKAAHGSFAERILSLKEIFPKETRKSVLVNHQAAAENLPLQWLQDRMSTYQGDRINTVLFSDTKDSLPGDMLNKVDWMSMRNSLEIRVPFLDYRVVELAFRIPGELKLRNGETKYILKETFKDILPRSLYRRPKAGFEVPISRWLKTDLKFLLDRYLDKTKITNQGLFDHSVIESLVHQHLSNKTDTAWMLWNLIVFQYWFEHYME